MNGRILSFTDRVGPSRVSHHGEGLVMADQLIDQFLKGLVMTIIIGRAVHDE